MKGAMEGMVRMRSETARGERARSSAMKASGKRRRQAHQSQARQRSLVAVEAGRGHTHTNGRRAKPAQMRAGVDPVASAMPALVTAMRRRRRPRRLGASSLPGGPSRRSASHTRRVSPAPTPRPASAPRAGSTRRAPASRGTTSDKGRSASAPVSPVLRYEEAQRTALSTHTHASRRRRRPRGRRSACEPRMAPYTPQPRACSRHAAPSASSTCPVSRLERGSAEPSRSSSSSSVPQHMAEQAARRRPARSSAAYAARRARTTARLA
mmetsp:Transcript_21214/g.71655  ORF Transcript_21214/g.71655 Transcript_21214/m.71655 type:complete len:267 (+) Transcript_21214:304-1104(+)